MVGDILGWKDALTTPSLAASLAVAKGQGLTQQEELLQAYAQSKLIATGAALTNGMFYVTPDAAGGQRQDLGARGHHRHRVAAVRHEHPRRDLR